MGFAEALARVPFVLSFASFLDESTQYADLVLPDHSYLERFDTRVPTGATNRAVLTTAQPVVEPFVNSRAAGDVMLAIAKALGGGAASALPWNSFVEFLQQAAAEIQTANRGSVRAGTAEEVWRQMLQRGGWWSDPGQTPAQGQQSPSVNQGAVQSGLRFEQPRFEGDANTFPYHLQVYESNSLGDGRLADLPWAQELPDPMTTAVWSAWVEINPETAQRLNLHERDLVEVESPRGKIQAPVYVYPGIAPEVVAMPLGQGHTAFGQYASRHGVSPLAILAPTADSQAGALAFGATRVKLTKLAGRDRLITIEGRAERQPGRAFFEGES
jgi:anaerobic selenocysteine-containing dehydrogenase